jgi:intracellular sulfur oxidation DsrE/DsrF family protein
VSDTPHSPSPRRRFITNLVGGTAALAAGTVGARELFAQGGGMPTYPPPQGGWDMSWTDKVEKAKHRLVIDCADVGDGLALTNAQTVLAGYKDVYNTTDADMALVVVIRHKAIQMVLNDDIWARWKIGEQLSVKDAGEPALRNTFAKSARGGGGSMESLMQRGVTILCCNLALMRSAGQFATAMSMPVDEARKLFIDSLVPGVIRQTNGVFAVTRAQEAGAHFLKST